MGCNPRNNPKRESEPILEDPTSATNDLYILMLASIIMTFRVGSSCRIFLKLLSLFQRIAVSSFFVSLKYESEPILSDFPEIAFSFSKRFIFFSSFSGSGLTQNPGDLVQNRLQHTTPSNHIEGKG